MDWRAALKSLIDDTKAHVEALAALQPPPKQVEALAPPFEIAPDETSQEEAPTVVNAPIPPEEPLAKPVEPAVDAVPSNADDEPQPQEASAVEELVAVPQSAPEQVAEKAVAAPLTHKSLLDSERADIARRVAEFKALQERLKREREEYCEATLARAREHP